MLTRQLEAYLNLPAVEAARESANSSSKPAINPMMTATVIRARMALAGAVPKMLVAVKQARLASLGSAAAATNNSQVQNLGGHVACVNGQTGGCKVSDYGIRKR